MKKVKIIFNNYCLKNIYVTIYDNNKVIYNGYTGNILKLNLEECKAYRIMASSNYGIINTSFYVNGDNTFRFSFNSNTNLITFYLVDYNYSNLPIERGEITLWQKQ